MTDEQVTSAPRAGAYAMVGGWLKGRSLKFKILAAALAVAILLLATGAVYEGCRRRAAQKADEKLERVADQAGREAGGAMDNANGASVDRRVNEAIYNEGAPRRARADRESEAARARLREAERKYADDKKNFRVSTGPLPARLSRAVANARAALAEPGPAAGDGGAGDGGGRSAGGDDRGDTAPPRTP